MKGDSLNKSTEKKDDERKTSDKNNHREEVNEELSTQKPIDSEKNIKNELKGIEIEEYPNYLNKLLKQTDWIKQNDIINILKNDFESKYQSILEKKKIEFIDNGGNEIDFYFTPNYKKEFYDLFKGYKYRKNQYFKELKSKQKTNLARKREIIEEIKNLIDKSQHDNNTYKNFKKLQEAFYNAGQVPNLPTFQLFQLF